MTAYKIGLRTYCSRPCCLKAHGKSSRTWKVEELHRDNPRLTTRQIGEIVGVSHQRVSYILQRQRREQDGGQTHRSVPIRAKRGEMA